MDNLKVRTVNWVEADFVEQILAAMKKRGVNRLELAHRLGVVPAYVTRLLSGTANLTIQTMVKMCDVLQCELVIGVKQQRLPKGYKFGNGAKDVARIQGGIAARKAKEGGVSE